MNDDIVITTQSQASTNVLPIRHGDRVHSRTADSDDLGQHILANEELVQLILDSEKHSSQPMTIEEFKVWLGRLHDER